MRANIVLSSFGVLLCSLTTLPTLADTLKITSEPSGATLEIDGVAVGKTPYEVNLPGGYFHRPRTMFGKRLSAPMRARIVLPGHVTQEIELTRGPLPFVSTKGVYHGDYYVLKSDHFHFDLKKTEDKLTGTAQPAHTGAKVAPELPPDRRRLLRETRRGRQMKLKAGLKSSQLPPTQKSTWMANWSAQPRRPSVSELVHTESA